MSDQQQAAERIAELERRLEVAVLEKEIPEAELDKIAALLGVTSGTWVGAIQASVKAMQARIAELEAQLARVTEALRRARDYLHNDFEPDNQSNTYHYVCAALAAAQETER